MAKASQPFRHPRSICCARRSSILPTAATRPRRCRTSWTTPRLSKPALYYHFQDKAGLFQALVHEAHDERYRLLRRGGGERHGIRAQLEAALAALFDYFRENRDLMRISFATMFAAPGEVPEDAALRREMPAQF